MNNFFITGLPRSRSAWFANFLTYGDSFCFHDGFRGLDSLGVFRYRLDHLDYFGNVGNSDPANALFWRRLSGWYPNAKWVVVQRDPKSVLEASKRAFGRYSDAALLHHKDRVDEVIRYLKPMVIAFDDLSVETAVAVARYVGVPCLRVRAEMLLRLQVQILPKTLHADCDQPPPAWLKNEL